MALQLQTVKTKLDTLSLKLGHDVDIQTRVRGISTKVQAASSAFKSTMSKEGSDVLVQKTILMSLTSPSDVKIKNMQSSLNEATRALQANRQQVIGLQTEIHSNIESCRQRKMKHETDISGKQSRLAVVRSEQAGLDSSIKAHDEGASVVEKGAADLENRAHDIRRSASRKRKSAGVGGILGVLVGVALAPFTGGTSLVLATAAAGINAGVNVNDAGECEKAAKKFRTEAAEKRNEVQRLRAKKASLECQKSSLETEVESLQSSKEKLSDASKVLKEVTDFFHGSVKDIDKVLEIFQNMETAMSAALLQTDSFKIIQNAFMQQPEQISSRSQVYLDQLKGTWTQLEAALLQHGANSVCQS